MSENKGWICHCKPASLKGKTCGHYNPGKGRFVRSYTGDRLFYCEACGCTKIASDIRKDKGSGK